MIRHSQLRRGAPLRRRTPLKATCRLEAGAPPRRTTPLRSINRERKARLAEEQFGLAADAVRQLPCCVCGKAPPSHPHHVRSRGAGGKAEATVPLCPPELGAGAEGHHQELHRIGRRTFELRHQIDLARVAAAIHNRRITAAVVFGSPAQVVEQWKRLAAAEVPS